MHPWRRRGRAAPSVLASMDLMNDIANLTLIQDVGHTCI